MKAIFSVAVVLGIGTFACAADKVDPVGLWKCDYKINEQNRTLELTIKKEGDKLSGVMSWPDQKGEKVKDLKRKDDTLTFSAVRKFMGNEFPLDFKLKIEGDKIKGVAIADIEGNKQEFEMEGKREKKDKKDP